MTLKLKIVYQTLTVYGVDSSCLFLFTSCTVMGHSKSQRFLEISSCISYNCKRSVISINVW